MSFSSEFVFSTQVDGVVFWPYLGTVKCQISRSFGASPLDTLGGGGLTATPDPLIAQSPEK